MNRSVFVTVFTSIYNRAYSLPRLYESLIHQTYANFEWLIIDDGSIDDTKRLVQQWVQEQKIAIRYYHQVNGGKHRAINRGVELAHGELFFIVDSDDYLPTDSLAVLVDYYQQVKGDNMFAGVAGMRAYPHGERICKPFTTDVLDADSVTFRQKHKMRGDVAEAFKTEVLRKYPFPEFAGEKFVTEDVVFNEIAKTYLLRCFNVNIYICQYLEDGLSHHLRQLHRQSPQGTMLYYSNLVRDSRFGPRRHIIDAVNFWRYLIPYKGRKTKLPLWCYILKPIGFLFYHLDLLCERNSDVNHREVIM